MDQLAKKAAEIALRIAAASTESMRADDPRLDEVEQLAVQILKAVSAIRVGKTYTVGEQRGSWAVMPTLTRQ